MYRELRAVVAKFGSHRTVPTVVVSREPWQCWRKEEIVRVFTSNQCIPVTNAVG